jgi:tRNA threonylcarbamoyl adenosine modification protein YeaZ
MILSVETAFRQPSLAILRGENVLAQWRGTSVDFAVSAELLLEIRRILERAEVELKTIERFAVVTGPGSFTGLRVGLATVKGLAAARKIPIVGVPTFAAVQFAAHGKICAVLPIARGEVFFQHKGEIRQAKLAEVLEIYRAEPTMTFIAPPETHREIADFAAASNLAGWIWRDYPPNLAVCAGRIAAAQIEIKPADARIIYGRPAAVRKN